MGFRVFRFRVGKVSGAQSFVFGVVHHSRRVGTLLRFLYSNPTTTRKPRPNMGLCCVYWGNCETMENQTEATI